MQLGKPEKAVQSLGAHCNFQISVEIGILNCVETRELLHVHLISGPRSACRPEDTICCYERCHDARSGTCPPPPPPPRGAPPVQGGRSAGRGRGTTPAGRHCTV